MNTSGFSIHATVRVLLAVVVLTGFLSATTREAFASPITFELQNVSFEGGGTLSGSVSIEPAGPGGLGSPWPITFINIVTDPNGSSLPSLTFNGNASYAPNQTGYDPGYLAMWLYNGDYSLWLSIPYADTWTYPSPLNISSQNYPLHTDQDDYPYTGSHIFYCSGVGCENGIANFNITGGSLQPVSQAVPDAGSAAMMLLGAISVMGVAVRKRRSKR